MASANSTSDPYANEQWKPIKGYEGFYEVSDHGRVRSVDRVIPHRRSGQLRLKGKIIVQGTDEGRHMFARLCCEGTANQMYVHRLVLEAFVGPCPEGMEGLHWDDDQKNNHLSNLRWGTRSDNISDMKRNGRHFQLKKTHCRRRHKLELPNLVPSVLKEGRRSCLACQRTHSYLGNHPEMKPDFKIISDQYYEAILRSAPAA